MADTQTLNYGYVKPEPGQSRNTWGGKLNDNLDALDADLTAIQAAVDQAEADIAAGAARLDTLEADGADGFGLKTPLKNHGGVTGAVTVSFADGQYHYASLNGAATLTISNPDNKTGLLALELYGNQAAIVNVVWAGVTLGTANLPATINYTKTYVLLLMVRGSTVIFLTGAER